MPRKPRRRSSKKRGSKRRSGGEPISERSAPSKPHDRLVKRMLSSPRYAADEIRSVLPPDLAGRVDWTTLRVEPGSYISRKHREYCTDLLFSAELDGRTAYVYLLLEHQSTSDEWMPLRMLSYLVQIWEGLRRNGLETPPAPVIVPIVLHHGEQGWSAARRLGELLDWDAELETGLRRHVPDFELIEDDLTRLPEQALLERDMLAATRLLLWVLRAVRVEIEPARIGEWARLVNETETTDREALEDLVRYLTNVDGGEAVIQALVDAGASEGVQEVVMGLRQQWEQQAAEKGRAVGREEGRKQGREEGRRERGAELLLKQLRFKRIDLPTAAEEKIRAASVGEHDRWLERIPTAETLDDVLD